MNNNLRGEIYLFTRERGAYSIRAVVVACRPGSPNPKQDTKRISTYSFITFGGSGVKINGFFRPGS